MFALIVVLSMFAALPVHSLCDRANILGGVIEGARTIIIGIRTIGMRTIGVQIIGMEDNWHAEN